MVVFFGLEDFVAVFLDEGLELGVVHSLDLGDEGGEGVDANLVEGDLVGMGSLGDGEVGQFHNAVVTELDEHRGLGGKDNLSDGGREFHSNHFGHSVVGVEVNVVKRLGIARTILRW